MFVFQMVRPELVTDPEELQQFGVDTSLDYMGFPLDELDEIFRQIDGTPLSIIFSKCPRLFSRISDQNLRPFLAFPGKAYLPGQHKVDLGALVHGVASHRIVSLSS